MSSQGHHSNPNIIALNTQANPPASEVQILLERIQHDPQYSDLVAQVQSDRPSPKNPIVAVLIALRNLLIADPSEFYGKAFVTPELKEQARITARVATASTLLDGFTNAPLLYFAFADMGVLSALIVSSAINLAIVKFSNDNATAVAGRKYGNRAWARFATGGLIAINALQSAFAGPGVMLLNDYSTVQLGKAKELIAENTQRVEELRNLSNPRYEAVQQRLEKLEQELKETPRSDPRWESLYAQINGIWAERTRDWRQVPLEQAPLSAQLNILREDQFRIYEAAKADWQHKLEKRAASGSDVAFLQRELPDLYSQHFHPDGTLKSGVEAVRIATQNFFGKLQQGDWQGLGFPLFFFGLSCITSTTACTMAIAYSRRPDVQKSRDPVIEAARNRWLEDQYRALCEQHHTQQHRDDPSPTNSTTAKRRWK